VDPGTSLYKRRKKHVAMLPSIPVKNSTVYWWHFSLLWRCCCWIKSSGFLRHWFNW